MRYFSCSTISAFAHINIFSFYFLWCWGLNPGLFITELYLQFSSFSSPFHINVFSILVSLRKKNSIKSEKISDLSRL
jgi:hypothetical protein